MILRQSSAFNQSHCLDGVSTAGPMLFSLGIDMEGSAGWRAISGTPQDLRVTAGTVASRATDARRIRGAVAKRLSRHWMYITRVSSARCCPNIPLH